MMVLPAYSVVQQLRRASLLSCSSQNDATVSANDEDEVFFHILTR